MPTEASAAQRYLQRTTQQLLDIAALEQEAIESSAQLAATSIRTTGRVFIFGSGHSQLAALEAQHRAGGLANVVAVYDPALSPAVYYRVGMTERLTGYADVILETLPETQGQPLGIVISNSGLNAVPIEFALGLRERRFKIVTLTSVQHSSTLEPTHESRHRLFEVADVCVDTHVGAGDTAISLPSGRRTGGLSTLLCMAILHAIFSRTAEILEAAGDDPLVLGSQNVAGNEERNADLMAKVTDE